MKKLVEYYRKFKEMRKDPRKKAITTLIMYFIFFAIMFSILGIVNLFEKNEKPSKTLDNVIFKLKNIDKYSYTYEVNFNEESLFVEGKRYLNQESLQLNDEKYYITGSNLFKVEENTLVNIEETPFIINILNFRPDKIYDYINDSNKLSSGQYSLSLNKFLNISNDDVLISDKSITIKIEEKLNEEIKIAINLSDYANYIDEEITNYELVINLMNINKIKEFDINGKDI